jgi:hypothetical protein
MGASKLTTTWWKMPSDFAVGRRRWLFIGHPHAGWRSAVIYSILISCRRRGLNPEEYLTDVLARLPSMKIHQIHELLPVSGNLHRRVPLEKWPEFRLVAWWTMKKTYTDKQGQYLAFIY